MKRFGKTLRLAALIASLTLGVVAFFFGTIEGLDRPAQANPTVTVGIDADPAATPANTADSLGSTESCIEVTAGQTFDIDTFLDGIPGGLPDFYYYLDRRGLSGFYYYLNFDNTRLEITAQNHRMLINAAGGTMLVDLSDGVPDTDGSHIVVVADFGTTEWNPPYTQGVLGRYTLHALTTAPSGLASLTLTTVAVADDIGEYTVDVITGATIAVDTACPTPTVEVDIKPGSDPNSINPGSKGVIPVAILTSDEFDATTVDPHTVRFGPEGAPVDTIGGGKLKAAIKDVDHDGESDLIMHFRTQETDIQPGDTEACLEGSTYDGIPIWGCDSVRTVPPHADADGDSHGVGLPSVFGDDIEASVQTDQQDACPDDPNDNAWPPDLNNDTAVDILDVLLFRNRILSALGDPGYDERFDLSFDGTINIVDVVTMRPFIMTSCE